MTGCSLVLIITRAHLVVALSPPSAHQVFVGPHLWLETHCVHNIYTLCIHLVDTCTSGALNVQGVFFLTGTPLKS